MNPDEAVLKTDIFDCDEFEERKETKKWCEADEEAEEFGVESAGAGEASFAVDIQTPPQPTRGSQIPLATKWPNHMLIHHIFSSK